MTILLPDAIGVAGNQAQPGEHIIAVVNNDTTNNYPWVQGTLVQCFGYNSSSLASSVPGIPSSSIPFTGQTATVTAGDAWKVLGVVIAPQPGSSSNPSVPVSITQVFPGEVALVLALGIGKMLVDGSTAASFGQSLIIGSTVPGTLLSSGGQAATAGRNFGTILGPTPTTAVPAVSAQGTVGTTGFYYQFASAPPLPGSLTPPTNQPGTPGNVTVAGVTTPAGANKTYWYSGSRSATLVVVGSLFLPPANTYAIESVTVPYDTLVFNFGASTAGFAVTSPSATYGQLVDGFFRFS